MTSENITVKINLLGKEYPVSCERSEESALIQASRLLDDKMRQIRNAGKTIGAERIAVMAALNFSHELSALQAELKTVKETSQLQIDKLTDKVGMVLGDI